MPYIGNPIYQSAFVTDTFSGDGTTTAFTMSVAPAGTTNVLVAVSGVLQDPSTYGVSGNTLTFSAAPPSGTGNISCRYLGIPVTGVVTTAYRTVTEFTATASQTTFTPPSYTVGFINVYRNGVLLGSADYTATNGTTVVLTTGATAGDLVTVESFRVESVLNAIPQSGGTFSGGVGFPGSGIWNSSGNVGVGTTSPLAPLDVVKAGDPAVRIRNSLGTGSSILFQDSDTGTTTSDGLFVGIDSSEMGYVWNYENQPIGFGTNNVERMRITTAGNLQFSTANAGIVFNNSSALNNQTLNDYEYGTWSPTVVASGGGTATYSYQTGYYVKIGQIVHVWFQLNFGRGSLSGSLGIGNLPFATQNITNVYSSAAIGYWGVQSTYIVMVNHIAQNGGTSNTNIRVTNGGTTNMGTALGSGDVASTNSNTFIMQWSYAATF